MGRLSRVTKSRYPFYIRGRCQSLPITWRSLSVTTLKLSLWSVRQQTLYLMPLSAPLWLSLLKVRLTYCLHLLNKKWHPVQEVDLIKSLMFMLGVLNVLSAQIHSQCAPPLRPSQCQETLSLCSVLALRTQHPLHGWRMKARCLRLRECIFPPEMSQWPSVLSCRQMMVYTSVWSQRGRPPSSLLATRSK